MLSEQQITAIIENKRVLGPQKDIQEVLNAIQVYDRLNEFRPVSEKDFLKAHALLMKDLIPDAGKYRRQGVGIMKGSEVAHIAPSYENVPFLMRELFDYLKNKEELTLIKSCVFHYEMEFIHPFMDGNGRMGRLWQTIILMSQYPIFEFLPFETLISRDQSMYYKALSDSDRQDKSTVFIEYMLGVMDTSLAQLLDQASRNLTELERLNYFIGKTGKSVFTRKNYMDLFRNISSATASRDLKKGLALGLFSKEGDKRTAVYRVV